MLTILWCHRFFLSSCCAPKALMLPRLPFCSQSRLVLFSYRFVCLERHTSCVLGDAMCIIEVPLPPYSHPGGIAAGQGRSFCPQSGSELLSAERRAVRSSKEHARCALSSEQGCGRPQSTGFFSFWRSLQLGALLLIAQEKGWSQE